MSGAASSPGRGALILFRADATAEIGGGHVMRLLALADEHVRRGGRSLFALNPGSAPLHAALGRRGHQVAAIRADADAEETCELARRSGASAVVVDGSFAGPAYERALAGRFALVAIDDGTGRTSAADILVNPNAGAEGADYRGERPIRILLGPRYALLRPEFLGRRAGADHPGAARLLVSFGSSDPTGGTVRALRCLPDAPHFEVLVVLGAHAAVDEVREAAERATSGGHVALLLRAPTDMADVMARADCAISAAGGTLLELAHLGCPALAFVVADNQRPGCRALAAAGCVAGGADLREIDDRELARQIAEFLADRVRRRQLADAARQLVDGRGASRVLSTLERYMSGSIDLTESTP